MPPSKDDARPVATNPPRNQNGVTGHWYRFVLSVLHAEAEIRQRRAARERSRDTTE